MQTAVLNKKNILKTALTTFIAAAAAVILPQLFHLVGILSGTDALPGASFLPMHLPVFAAGLLGGPICGLAAGAVSPILSSLISGMPVAAIVPLMTVELAGYGLVSGLLSKTRLPVVFNVIIAQIAGRVLKLAGAAAAVHILGNNAVTVASVIDSTVVGLPGILLQILLLPLFVYRIKNTAAKNI